MSEPATVAAEKPRSEKAESKRVQILEAATELIIERGYDGTSLRDICERASCSRSAIYDFFNNKEGLLAALTEDIAVGLSQSLHAFHMQHLGVREALLRYSRMAMELILDDRHIAIVRATISSVWKHPDLGPTYYQVGGQTAQLALSQYFKSLTESGDQR